MTRKREKKNKCGSKVIIITNRKKNCQNLRTFEEEGLRFSPIAVDIGGEKGGAE